MENNIIKIDKDLEDLIPQYLENRTQDIKTIDEALTNSDYNSIQSLAHKIAGNAGGYGFDKLGHIGKEMENGAKSQDHKKIAESFEQYKLYIESIKIEYI